MYATDLINEGTNKKVVRYYFAKMGRQVRVTLYENGVFAVAQLFEGGKINVYKKDQLGKFLRGVNRSSNLIEIIRYK
jgi:hypothetical protein